MRILIVKEGDIATQGGTRSHTLNLLRGLKGLGHEADLFTPYPMPKRYRYPLYSVPLRIGRMLGIKWHALRLYQRLTPWYIRKQLAILQAKRKYDIICCQDPLSAFACSGALPDGPMVMVLHTYFNVEMKLNYGVPESHPLYQRTLQNYLEGARAARRIICVDNRIGQHVKDTLPEKAGSVTVVLNFIDTDRFSPSTDEQQAEARRRYGVPLGRPLLLCPRRFVEKNGVTYAVEAMSHLSDTQAVLVFAGHGPLEASLRRQAADLGAADRIVFLGAVPNEEMATFYALGGIVLIPSVTVEGLQEATSIAALEAMSCGLPVVASNIGGLPEIIQHDQTGVLTPERDAEGLARQIRRLLDDSAFAAQLGARAREYVVQHHSIPSASRVYAEIFREAASA